MQVQKLCQGLQKDYKNVWIFKKKPKSYQLVHDGNRVFIESLTERQKEYYFSLTESWRKELVRLEDRG